VDDAAPLRALTRLLLEGCGYTVLDSGDPADAIEIAARHNGPLPLLITDVVMPGFSGPILAERLRVLRPEMKVLYTSGYADDEVAQHGLIGTNRAYLEKPFGPRCLNQKSARGPGFAPAQLALYVTHTAMAARPFPFIRLSIA
jgi:two-component system cell cycle sensor histidine kinase/response regulator CckA